LRMARPEPQFQANTNDFKVEILEFEGKLDPEVSRLVAYC